jgi:hypothetical protein
MRLINLKRSRRLSKESKNERGVEETKDGSSVSRGNDDCIINRSWTEEEDSCLKAMLKKGETAQKIAVALGRTRNSVIGRAWRIKNSDHVINYDKRRSYKRTLGYKKVVESRKDGQTKMGRSPDKKNLLKFLENRKSKRALRKLVGRKSSVIPRPGCDIHSLREGHCRYIISGTASTGEDAYKYCGHPTIYKSYCYKHANVVYANEFEGDCSTIPDHSTINN